MQGISLRTNYVLIDYENVQPEALSVLDAEHFKVIVFVGAQELMGSASHIKIQYDAAPLIFLN